MQNHSHINTSHNCVFFPARGHAYTCFRETSVITLPGLSLELCLICIVDLHWLCKEICSETMAGKIAKTEMGTTAQETFIPATSGHAILERVWFIHFLRNLKCKSHHIFPTQTKPRSFCHLDALYTLPSDLYLKPSVDLVCTQHQLDRSLLFVRFQ